jgi:general secretion pathway protein J
MKSKGTSLNTQHSTLNTESGFTLLEVLVAVAITVVVMTALYATFSLSRRAVDAVDDSLIRMQESRAILDTLRREIESALYRREGSYTMFKVSDRDFYGKQASQLVFTSFSPVLPGLVKIEYIVEEKEGKLVLGKKISSAFGPETGAKSTELAEDIESFTVEAGTTGKLVKTWDSAAGGMPDLVKISIRVNTKKGESPLTLSETARPRRDRSL